MYSLPDHPVIRNMELTGYPDGRTPDEPKCPSCQKEPGAIYKNDSAVIGCDCCVRKTDAEKRQETECPVCGGAWETAYTDKNDNILGCDCCIQETDPWEETECFPTERSAF